MNCEKHGTRMSLWERDRCGATWMCGECLTEISKELSLDHVITRLEAIVQERGPDDPLIGRTLSVPESLIKLALRQLRARASTATLTK